MKKPILVFLLLSLTTWSCSTSSISLQVLQPSQIVFPDYVQNIAIIDRSKPAKGFKAFAEGLFSGEDIGQDREGRHRAIQGLITTLGKTPRYNAKTTGLEYTNPQNGRSMGPPLSWREVEDLCRQYSADIIIALESFDSNSNIQLSTSSYKQKDKSTNLDVQKTRYTANRNLRLYVGWRAYDPKAHAVLDDNTTNEFTNHSYTGDTETLARNGLYSQINAVRELAGKSGEIYAMRVAPVYVNVSRSFFNTAKGNDKNPMEEAFRYTKVNQWDKASDVWVGLVNDARDYKTKGKAAINLAVAAERDGNLTKALDWAQKAYSTFGNKQAQNYIATLQQRISDQERLMYQYKAKP
jgi:hypothetical protein